MFVSGVLRAVYYNINSIKNLGIWLLRIIFADLKTLRLVKTNQMPDLSSQYQRISEAFDVAIFKDRLQVVVQDDDAFAADFGLSLSGRAANSTHVCHQYSSKSRQNSSKIVQEALKNKGIPSMAYYPLPLYKQKAYFALANLPVTATQNSTVLSLPMGADMGKEPIDYNYTHY